MKEIPVIDFINHRFSDDYLFNVHDLSDVRQVIRRTPVFCESYYDLLLITEGTTVVKINGHAQEVHAGIGICTRLGDVWEWEDEPIVEGYHLIFDKVFISNFLQDSDFINRIQFLNYSEESPFVYFHQDLYDHIRIVLRDVVRELEENETFDIHLNRAFLYGLLVLFSRGKRINVDHHSADSSSARNRFLVQFLQLIDKNIANHHDVDFYADQLCITSNYLNKIVHHSLGKSAKEYILSRIMQQACRSLRHTTLTVQEIATQLSFENTTYFCRIFKKYMKMSPTSYRSLFNVD